MDIITVLTDKGFQSDIFRGVLNLSVSEALRAEQFQTGE